MYVVAFGPKLSIRLKITKPASTHAAAPPLPDAARMASPTVIPTKPITCSRICPMRDTNTMVSRNPSTRNTSVKPVIAVASTSSRRKLVDAVAASPNSRPVTIDGANSPTP